MRAAKTTPAPASNAEMVKSTAMRGVFHNGMLWAFHSKTPVYIATPRPSRAPTTIHALDIVSAWRARGLQNDSTARTSHGVEKTAQSPMKTTAASNSHAPMVIQEPGFTKLSHICMAWKGLATSDTKNNRPTTSAAVLTHAPIAVTLGKALLLKNLTRAVAKNVPPASPPKNRYMAGSHIHTV